MKTRTLAGLRWIAAASLAAVLAYPALTQGSSSGTGTTAGMRAPAFTAKDTAGKPVSLTTSYKNKVVLLDFWASWCGPCRSEVPHLRSAYAKYKGRGFEILSISVDRDTNAAKAFVRENKMVWRQVLDADTKGAISAKYNIQYIPATFLVDGNTGKIIATELRGDGLDKAVAKALKDRKR